MIIVEETVQAQFVFGEGLLKQSPFELLWKMRSRSLYVRYIDNRSIFRTAFDFFLVFFKRYDLFFILGHYFFLNK